MFLAGHPLTVRQGIDSKIPIRNGSIYRDNSRIAVDSFIRDLKILEQDPNAAVFQGETSELLMKEAAIAECYKYENIRWPGASPTVSYYINENTSDCTGEGAAVQAAANTWNDVGANFMFSYAGGHSNTTSSQNFVNEVMWGTTSGSVATAAIWYYPSTGEIVECDIVFNDVSYNWSSTTPGPSQMDVRTVGLHELGHWLNLEDLYNSEDSGNVMYGYVSNGQVKRTLQPCDISGICYIYGGCAVHYMLSVNSSGASGVSISSSTGHGGTTNYTKSIESGTGVTLTAPTTASGKIFNGWTGDVISSNQTISFTMTGTKSVTANYVTPSYTLSVNSSGTTGVSISSSTGHGGTTNYTQTITGGTGVTLTAPLVADGNNFTGWTGDVNDSNRTISFAMNGNKNVTANFVTLTPVLHPEPYITPGLCNRISWNSVLQAKAYYAECSSDPCFLVVDYSSGWITGTFYQFCGLSTCQNYWYRVKSGLSAWSQTSQAEFQNDTLIDTAATSGGDVILLGRQNRRDRKLSLYF